MKRTQLWRTYLLLARDTLLISACIAWLSTFICCKRVGTEKRPVVTMEIQESLYGTICKLINLDMLSHGGELGNDFRVSWRLYSSVDALERDAFPWRMKEFDAVRERPIVVVMYRRKRALPKGVFGLTERMYVFDAASPTNLVTRSVE